MASSTSVILVIADISGYTDFMQRHPVVSSHAREITIRLLETLISRSSYPFQVSEIEGDAVFFYIETRNLPASGSMEQIRTQLINLFRAFNNEVARLQSMDVCECEACGTVDSLVLKEVVHAGEATIESISRFRKLLSLDVILVHRLLKNTVAGRQYILFSDPAYRMLGPFFDVQPERHVEDVADIGPVECLVVEDSRLSQLIQTTDAASLEPTWLERTLWKLRLLFSRRRQMKLWNAPPFR